MVTGAVTGDVMALQRLGDTHIHVFLPYRGPDASFRNDPVYLEDDYAQNAQPEALRGWVHLGAEPVREDQSVSSFLTLRKE